MKSDDTSLPQKFMIYPPNSTHKRQAYLQPRTLQELKAVSKQQIKDQFYLLSEVDFPEQVFYLKKTKMNRYIDIFAYEHSRIKIDKLPNYYVNANEVKSIVDGKIYATFSQAPVPPFDNFWEAIYYKNINLVIMLCSFYDPKRGHQAQQYWPEEGEPVKFSSNLKVTKMGSKVLDTDFTETVFKIQGPDGQKQLRHQHWTGWSDLRKPAEHKMKPFEFLIEECLKCIQEGKPYIIHCSAGIGRTGTLGGIVDSLRFYKEHKKLSIFGIVQNMRKYRYHAVQTFEQYNFMYEYLKNKLE